MAKRQDRVNELLRREISGVLQRDFEWKNALVTVSDVDVTQDLKEAKVFVSILGGSAPGILDQLERKRGFIQGKVSKRVVLRNTPVLMFRQDKSAVRGVEVVNLLDEVSQLPTAPLEDEESSGSI
ncbi:MAG: ribosome-binding factor A [Verrucomicrobiaceae bacterium TMED137]|jgi:ribosome-binding factor A|nr:ribosome-binding factor A [Verrucomicrobiales bacterium]OUV80584.1 MAG: ribosome-binding factor A [Verrucomicrobiaceae bacterium TMED137]RZN92217.1 MAG: 30S ribosome-binding factor RbfA [Verrucomicrobiaceae bacterium]HAE19266.1 30S ribosome-binding factor RbfA [Verrucomicrobiales bacterium]HAN83604.1 30S ribosome-binding factor RbfA [Verrucomicrobiales bacterium]|tara:strand:+ start:477 stop:851 length:375 start_codon:yes stop_codon:yes gene_type:complete